MSIIDDLRHRQMVVAEHLDLPRRRADAEQRIRNYYAAHNIPVDDALVAQGVRAYFDGRLEFRPAAPGKLAGLLSRLYVKRGEHAKAYGLWLGCAATCLAMWGGMNYRDHWRLHRDSREHVAQLAEVLEQARASQKDVIAQAVQLAGRSGAAHAQLRPAAAMLAQVQAGLQQTEATLKDAAPEADAITADNRGAFLAALGQRKAEAQSAQAVLTQAQHTLQRLELMLGAQSAMLALQRQYSEAVLWNAPAIRQQVRKVQLALEENNGAGATAAQLAVTELGTQLAQAALAEGHLQDVRQVVSLLGKMGLSGDDRLRVQALSQSALSAAAQLDAGRVEALAAQAEALLSFARLPLNILVADRDGVRSGVERNYNASGGKSWYLIVEALDAEGNNVQVPVRNAETGDSTWTEFYGVRVSRSEYERVKAEKQSSGHVDSREMGSKPANSLTVRYARTLKAQPDTITEW
ncbi:hypothetical protein ASD15_00190 [Massilia sp. Root351]|nr:hypothetical protein ASD15_00190 [Massilia sp. Root351]